MTPAKRTDSLPHSGNITRAVLPNGICVLIHENHNAQSVVFSGVMEGGSLYEPPALNGLASLTSSALMRGTHTRGFEAIHGTLEDIGADLGVSAGTHRVGFNGKALAEDLPVMIQLLSDVLRNPSFPVDQVERLRGERLTWLRYQEQDTRRQVARAFRSHLYPPSHPYHYSPPGTTQTIAHLTADHLRDFHSRHYGARGLTLCVVGAVNAGEVVDLVARWLGDWENPDQPDVPALPALQPGGAHERVMVPIPGKTQTDLMLGVVGPSRLEPGFQAASLANSVLGQFGMMGRIGEVVREKSGMAYYAYSRLEGGMGPGAWLIAAGVNPKNVERTIELCLREIDRIADELIDPAELADNQSYYIGRLPLQLESNEGLCATILTMELYQLGLDYLLTYRDLIMSLTREDLRDAVRRYWSGTRQVVAIAGSEPG